MRVCCRLVEGVSGYYSGFAVGSFFDLRTVAIAGDAGAGTGFRTDIVLHS